MVLEFESYPQFFFSICKKTNFFLRNLIGRTIFRLFFLCRLKFQRINFSSDLISFTMIEGCSVIQKITEKIVNKFFCVLVALKWFRLLLCCLIYLVV